MTAFLNKFFIDKFFILYFYISNSATYDFYVTIFLNLIAVFYFFFMLYILNFIAFLRNNFFNDLRVTNFIGYLLGISLGHDPEKFKRVMGLLAYYGYMVLTALEVSIKSSFLVIIGYFVVKAPFINLDPSPISSWKFADLFSKSRFYSFRPWTLSSSRSYRGFSSGNFSSEGTWFADDNDYVESLYPQLLPYSEDFNHEDIFLRPGGTGLRLRMRVKALAKFSATGRNSGNWTRHLLGSRRDRGAVNRITAPRHRLERIKTNFSRNKSLELKSPIHSSFSYYRSEDDCYPISVKKGFLSRLYVPGFGSKARKNLIHEQGFVPRYTSPLNARQKYFITAFAGVDFHQETDPYIRLSGPGREELDEAGRPVHPAERDVYKEYRDKESDEIANTLQSGWLDYVGRVDSLRVENPTNYVGARRFGHAYNKLRGLVNKRSRAANHYNLPNKESRALNDEERTLMSYLRYLANDHSDVENAYMSGRYALLLNRNTPFRLVVVDKDESPLYNYTFDNKFSSVHNLRGKHVYRRSLLDFINVQFLGYLRSFSNFFGFDVERSATTPSNPAIGTSSREELFGFMINDRKKFYRRTFRYGIVDDDNRPFQFRGRESFDLNYATAGSKFRYFFDSSSFRVKERVPENSFIDRSADDREIESSLFESASDDRKVVNEGVYLHKKLRTEGSSLDLKDFYSLGNVGFLNQYYRMFYQFVLDHFTYWLRIVAGMAGRNHYIPHFPSPASSVADKSMGLNPYALFFKTFYFFRKCFRVVLFGFMSDKGSYSSGTGCGLGGKLGSQSLGETSDFTLIALQKTLFSYFTRLLGLLLILVLNGFSAGFSAVLDFTLSHITASIFAVLLVIVSLFRVRYPYEFSFNRLFFKSKSLLTTPLFNLFTRAARFVAVPFKTVAEFLGILIRFLSIARAQSPRKAKESAEVYHERLVKEHQIMTNVIGFFKVDRIRRVLSRFGLLRSRGSRTGFQGHDKSILEVIFPKSLRRIGMSAYKERFSLRSRLAMLIQKRFNLSRLIEERVVTHRRLRSPSLLRYIRAGPTAVRKRKTIYFSFEPTEEFLRFKNSVMVTVNFVKVQTLRAMEFVKQRQDLRKDLPVKRHRREKELKRSFRKVVSSTMRVSRNTVSYVKWKLTEWINKQ